MTDYKIQTIWEVPIRFDVAQKFLPDENFLLMQMGKISILLKESSGKKNFENLGIRIYLQKCGQEKLDLALNSVLSHNGETSNRHD